MSQCSDCCHCYCYSTYYWLLYLSRGAGELGSGEGSGGHSVSPSSVPGWQSTMHQASLGRSKRFDSRAGLEVRREAGLAGLQLRYYNYISCKGRGWYVVDGWSLRTYLIFKTSSIQDCQKWRVKYILNLIYYCAKEVSRFEMIWKVSRLLKAFLFLCSLFKYMV